MKSYWCICINARGTKWLKEGMKYLIQPRGTKAIILRDEKNPHRRYTQVNKNRFKMMRESFIEEDPDPFYGFPSDI